jgi:ferrochelatase
MPAQFSRSTYDALIVVSFGGPEGPNDVKPFLENVLRGRNAPLERMLAVAKHYEQFGGVSPINGQNRKLIAALEHEFAANGPQLPVYFGNRNWHPLLADTVRQMQADGIGKALAFVTSAYSSYSSCRQYLENIAEARATVGPAAPEIEKIRAFYNHPEFIRANVEQIKTALAVFPEEQRDIAHLVFTAHSIPQSMAGNCDYQRQVEETGRLIIEELAINDRLRPYSVAYQSRSGPPSQPWLEPDICDHLRVLKAGGVKNVLVAPAGFVSDHMEVLYDLDYEAKQLSQQLGMNLSRATTAGSHPAFVKMIRELVMERMDHASERRFLGTAGPRPDNCEPGCCSL